MAAFDFALLPQSLLAWVRDISDRMQCPPDYVAATAMIVAGALIGRTVVIRPKRHDDWAVVPNLYGMMIGRPSLLKSPAMKEVINFLIKLEIQAKAEYQIDVTDQAAAALVSQAERAIVKAKLKKAVESGDGDARELARQMAAADDAPPVRRRYMTNDATVEKLGIILAENPNGVTMFADELIRLLKTMLSLNWLAEREERTDGRPRTRYTVNPKTRSASRHALTEPTKTPSVGFVTHPPAANGNLRPSAA